MSSIKMCEKCNLSNNACNLTALFNFPIIFSDVLNTQRMKNDLGISTWPWANTLTPNPELENRGEQPNI